MPPIALPIWWCHCPQGLAQPPRGQSTRAYTNLLDRLCHPLHLQFGGATGPMALPRHSGVIAPVLIHNSWIDSATHCAASLVVLLPSSTCSGTQGHSTRAHTTLLDRFCHPLHCHYGGATALKGLPNHPGAKAPGPIQKYWIDTATHCTAILVVSLPSSTCSGTQRP